jgi:hypothetical protein
VNATLAGGRNANAKPSGELGVSARGKPSGLFMPDLNKPNLACVGPKGVKNPVHAIVGTAEIASMFQLINLSTSTCPTVFLDMTVTS